MDDNLIYYGDTVKALGDGKVGGYLVRWGGPKDVDLAGDFFDKNTELGITEDAKLPIYYEHGYDGHFKGTRIGRGYGMKFDDIGAWLEAQLEVRDDYERELLKLAEAGKLGWSSGAAGHLVERESVGKSWYIKSWPIAEASLTTTPAEARNCAVSIKSIYEKQPEEIQDQTQTTIEEVTTMTEEIFEPTVPEVKAIDTEALINSAVEQALKAYDEAHAPTQKGGFAGVVEDEADKALRLNPFTPREFFQEVKKAGFYPGQIDKRLLALKATGLNEAIPSQGGFLVQNDIAEGIQQNMWGVGTVLKYFNAYKVDGNGLTINAIDETSRAAGSRMGGVLGYWMAEGADKTATKPKFRQIDLKLKKVAALCYATDELLADASALESWITRHVPDELRFLVEDGIIDGDGVGKPLGILQSGSLVSATRTDASEVDAADVGRMWAARYAGVSDYIWFINPSVMPQLLQMSIGNMPMYISPNSGLSGLPYGQLMGRPVIETEYNPYLGTLGDILLASPSQYALITKSGVEAAKSIHVAFVSDESVFRFVYRVDGEPMWASAVTAFDGTASISPFVALGAST